MKSDLCKIRVAAEAGITGAGSVISIHSNVLFDCSDTSMPELLERKLK